jgi:hypothetical protein
VTGNRDKKKKEGMMKYRNAGILGRNKNKKNG